MRIIEATTSERSKKPEMPNIQHLMDKGLMEGFQIDAEQPTKTRVQSLSSSTAANIPDANITSTEGGWVRQMLPSRGTPYNRTEPFWVQPLNVEDLSRVHAAQQVGERGDSQQALTMLVDALAPKIKDFDIRDLTVPDFYSFLYWLRINSYTRSPFTVNWTSKYGNENAKRLTMSSFEFKELDMPRSEYIKWRDKGITFPTVRDMEVLASDDVDEANRWKMTYAQYVYIEGPATSDQMKRKVAKFIEMGPDAVPDINEFTELSSHGVVEQIKVKDEKFDAETALKYLAEQIENLTYMLEVAVKNADEDEDMDKLQRFFYFQAHIEDLNRMHKDIKTCIETNTKYEVEEEVVTLAPANATMLFP